jgi:tRNA(fMet)-specific endonuclease VapC
MAPNTLLDTDILSMLMRGTPAVLRRAKTYLADHPVITLSMITRFEILRGLKANGATTRLTAFDAFCAANEILSLSDATIRIASDLYADLHTRGQLLPDADILIAAAALEHGLVLATNNIKDFSRINGLTIDNWLV